MLFVLIFLVAIAVLLYYYYGKAYSYWRIRGVSQTEPTWFFGDSLRVFFKLEGFAKQHERLYNLFPGKRYYGIYEFSNPHLVIRDPDLIKQICVKDFENFMDRKSFVPKENDPLWARNLVLLEGQEWKDMRNLVSPAFTTSKMKFLFNLLTECAENFIEHFVNKNQDIVEFDTEDAVTCYTNDAIASVAFGANVNSLANRKNEFMVEGKKSVEFGFLIGLKFFGYMLVPRLFEIFKISLIPKSASTFFTNVVNEAIKIREEKGIVRPDMLHLLLEARKTLRKQIAEDKSTLKDIPNGDIAAQAFIFYLGGFDTVTSNLCCLTYEMAVNTDIQNRLRKEIEETMKKCDGKLTYDALVEMKYMDMVLSETLRKWPSMLLIQRLCTKPYTIQPAQPDEKPIYLEKDVELTIPTIGIHRDPKYYPNPEKFDPERFNDENKDSIHPYTYLPFGFGPRSCLGNRFAIMEAKTLLFHILHNFEIVPVAKSVIPLRVSKSAFSLKPEGKLILGLKRIQRKN